MIRREEELLAVLRGSGFDFTSTVRTISARFPVESDWGVQSSQIVPFRLARPFAGLGVGWKIAVNREVEYDLPPTRYTHEFHPNAEASANHEQAVAQLTETLGPGELTAATNVYGSSWRVGFFTVRVTTWPRERNRGGHNIYQGKNPYLWVSANVAIEPDFPFVEPIADGREGLQSAIGVAPGCTIDCQSMVYARRYRTAPRAVAVGLAGSNLIVRGADRAVIVPVEDTRGVRLTRLTPGRYSGSSRLSVGAVFLSRHEVDVPVMAGEATGSLDATAQQLAQALGKPLSIEEYSDDG